jgi:hypothetical protein
VNPAALAAELAQMGVTPVDASDPNRALLYLPELRATRTFLTTTLAQAGAGGLGAGYAFCSAALTSPNLLQELSEVLDFFIGPAVIEEIDRLNPNRAAPAFPTLNQFYNTIFDPADATYVTNRNTFLARYPVTQAAVAQLARNFQNNIFLACRRIVDDKATIEHFFADRYPFFFLRSLQEIKSTGSDFHKGGKQVLILRFAAVYSDRDTPKVFQFRLVYKPSDLEIDCLIAGDSAAINAVIPNFMAESLVEIFNDLRSRQSAAPNALPLPTYRILPREYMRAQPAGNPPFAALPNLYGYIEYLSYDAPSGFSAWGYYPFGSSDFVIFRSAGSRPKQVTDFYQQAGELLALACTFSLMDLHFQNVRVRGYQPYLIDLEISIGTYVTDALQTLLLSRAGGIGGFNGYELAGSSYQWIKEQPYGMRYETLSRDDETERFQNRLYKLNPTRHLVQVEPFTLIRGLSDGLTILANAPGARFDVWWARLDNTLVRDLPYSTSEFRALRNQIFRDRPAGAWPATISVVINAQFVADYGTYVASLAPPAPPPPPKYLALAPNITNLDYQALDIPIFYRRVDQTNIVDSRGAAIPIPANVVINGVAQPSRVGRATYYAAPLVPILRAQLQSITGPGNLGALARRTAGLRGQVLGALGRNAAPLQPAFAFTAVQA